MEIAKKPINLEMLFPIGEVRATIAVSRALQKGEVIDLVKKHAKGDWGETPDTVRCQNEVSLQRKVPHPIISRHRLKSSFVEILTNPERTETVLRMR